MENSISNKNEKQIKTKIMNKKEFTVTPKEVYDWFIKNTGSREKLINKLSETNSFYKDEVPSFVEDVLSNKDIEEFIYDEELWLEVYEKWESEVHIPYYEDIKKCDYPEWYEGFNKPRSEWTEEELDECITDGRESDFSISLIPHIINFFQVHYTRVLDTKIIESINEITDTFEKELPDLTLDIDDYFDDELEMYIEHSYIFSINNEIQLVDFNINIEGNYLVWNVESYDEEQYLSETEEINNIEELVTLIKEKNNELKDLEVV